MPKPETLKPENVKKTGKFRIPKVGKIPGGTRVHRAIANGLVLMAVGAEAALDRLLDDHRLGKAANPIVSFLYYFLSTV